MPKETKIAGVKFARVMPSPVKKLCIKNPKEYLNISDDAVPIWDGDNRIFNFGGLKIKSYGRTNNFLVNYYGPPSGYKFPGDENIKASAAFIKLKGDVKIKHYDKTIFNDGYLGENIYENDFIRIGAAPSFSAFPPSTDARRDLVDSLAFSA